MPINIWRNPRHALAYRQMTQSQGITNKPIMGDHPSLFVRRSVWYRVPSTGTRAYINEELVEN